MNSKYYVWGVGSGYPVFEHVNEKSAVIEAKRLANYHRGKRFIVVKSIGHVESPVQQETFVKHEDEVIPF